MRRLAFAMLAVGFAASVAFAAEPKELPLADVKLTPAFKDSPKELFGYNGGDKKLFLYSNGTATAEFTADADGPVKVVLELSGDMGKTDRAKFKLTVGGTVVEEGYSLKQNEAKEYTFKAEVKKGKQKVEIEFLNDEYKEGEYDCNLYIHAIKVGK